MRKFAVTTFALFYGLFIISATAERANDWAAKLSPFRHSAQGHSVPSLERSDLHLRQTKIFEQGFVVESPREGISLPTRSDRHTPLFHSKYHATWVGQAVSPRAPPVQI